MSKICVGCGIELQTEFEDKMGYTKSIDMDYCMRCFRMTHYGEIKNTSNINPDMIIEKLNKQDGLIFFFIDFLNLHCESLNYFKKIKGPKVLVITKIDLIPKSIYLDKVKLWLKKVFKINEQIFFIQKNKKTSIKKLEDYWQSLNVKNVYFAGITNAGKSTFLNGYLGDNVLTTSTMPNTTLEFIPLKINEEFWIYDTPGLTFNSSKNYSLTKEIKPLTYQMKENEGIMFDDYFCLYFSNATSVTWFGPNKLKKVFKKSHLEDRFEVQVSSESNLFIKGIGIFYIKNSCTIIISGLLKENIDLSPSFLGKKEW